MDSKTILMMMHTIGLSVIALELRQAKWAYTNPRFHPRTASDSLAFIQGTGLDIVIDYYHLEYDPDSIRNVFFSMVGDHAKISYLRNRMSSHGQPINNCLKSLGQTITENKFEYEIIVVTSDEVSLKKIAAQHTNVKVVNVQGGVAKKRNVGTRFSSGEYFAFFDDDVEVTPYSIFYMLESFKGKVGMVYGKLLNMEHRDRFDEAGSFLTWSGFLYARCESGIRDTGQLTMSARYFQGNLPHVL